MAKSQILGPKNDGLSVPLYTLLKGETEKCDVWRVGSLNFVYQKSQLRFAELHCYRLWTSQSQVYDDSYCVLEQTYLFVVVS